jgi:hypothetical protein
VALSTRVAKIIDYPSVKVWQWYVLQKRVVSLCNGVMSNTVQHQHYALADIDKENPKAWHKFSDLVDR